MAEPENDTTKAVQALRPEPPPHTRADPFDEQAYNKRRCRMMNKQLCQGDGDRIIIDFTDEFGPCAKIITHRWTKDEKQAFLSNGTIPIIADSENNDAHPMLIKFVQVRGRSPQFPGKMDDLGRPLNFMHIGQPDLKIMYVMEAIDAGPQHYDENGDPKVICTVPSSFLDTPQRRQINAEFLRTGDAKVNPIIVNFVASMPGGTGSFGRNRGGRH